MAENVADSVRIVFETAGLADMQKAFESLEKRAKSFEDYVGKVGRSGVSERKKATADETKERAKADSARVKSTERSESDSTKVAERAAKERARIVDNSAKMAGRLAVQAANAEIREEERIAKAKQRIRENSANMAGRLAAQQAAAEQRAANRANGSGRAGGQRLGGIIGNSAGRALGGIAAVAGGALALGGGFSVMNAMRGELAADKAARSLAVASFVPGSAGGKGIRLDPAMLLNQAKGVQAETNIDKTEAIRGAQSYIDASSDLSLFDKMSNGRTGFQEMARISKATGADIGDVMSTAGILRSQNANLSQDGVMAMMMKMIGQSKLGSVSTKEMAEIAPKAAATSGLYGGDQAANQAGLLGLVQLARKTNGSGAEAATAVARLGTDVMHHRDELEGMGIHVKNKDGSLVSRADILGNMFEKAHGDVGMMGEGKGHFGLGRDSLTIAEALKSTYDAAEKAKKGSGSQAVRNSVSSFENADYSTAQLQEDLAIKMAASGEKLEAALNHLSNLIAEKATPYLEKFIAKLPEIMPKFEQIIDGATKLADFFVENPFSGVGALVGANIGAEILKASISSTLSKAAGSLAAGMGAETVALLGATPAIAALAVAAAVAGEALIDHISKGAVDASKDAIGADISTHSAILQHKRGAITDDQLKAQIAANDKMLDPDNRGWFESFNANPEAKASLASENQKAKDELARHSVDLTAEHLKVAKETLAAVKSNGGSTASSGKTSPERTHPISARPVHN